MHFTGFFRSISTLGSDELIILQSPGYPQKYGFNRYLNLCMCGRVLVVVHVVRVSKLHMVLHKLCVVQTCMGGVANISTGHLI